MNKFPFSLSRVKQRNSWIIPGYVALSLMAGMLISGCAPKPDDSPRTETAKLADKSLAQDTVQTPEKTNNETAVAQDQSIPEPGEKEGATSVLGEIATIDNPFDLYEARLRWRAEGAWKIEVREDGTMQEDQLLQAAYERRMKELADGLEPKKEWQTASLSLLAADFRHIGGDNYRMYWLFVPHESFDYGHRIHVDGYLEKEHLHLLPEVWKQRGRTAWAFNPDPPMTQWAVGEPIIQVRTVQANSAPYNIKIKIGNTGPVFDTGWWAAVPGETDK